MKISDRLYEASHQGGWQVMITPKTHYELSFPLLLAMSCRNLEKALKGEGMRLLGMDVRIGNDPRKCKCGTEPQPVAQGVWLECACGVKK